MTDLPALIAKASICGAIAKLANSYRECIEMAMTKHDHELLTLRRALKKSGAVVRLRTFDSGKRVRADIYWTPPAEVPDNMRPFMSSMPLALIKDFRGNGFTPATKDAPAADIKNLIFAATFESDKPGALEIARTLAAMHLMDRREEIAWADRE